MLNFGTIVVIRMSNYLSESQIGQSYYHDRVCRFGLGSGQIGPIPYFFNVPYI